MAIETIGNVYMTDDLSIFKTLEGNRSIGKARERKRNEEKRKVVCYQRYS